MKSTQPYTADTYDEDAWERTRTRWADCHKVIVGYDEATAQARAQQITERSLNNPKYACTMKAYKGKCGHWHVSRV